MAGFCAWNMAIMCHHSLKPSTIQPVIRISWLVLIYITPALIKVRLMKEIRVVDQQEFRYSAELSRRVFQYPVTQALTAVQHISMDTRRGRRLTRPRSSSLLVFSRLPLHYPTQRTRTYHISSALALVICRTSLMLKRQK